MNRDADSSTETLTEEAAPAYERIASRAYEIWERAGCPDGHALEHWLAAERALQPTASANEEVFSAARSDPPLTPHPGGGSSSATAPRDLGHKRAPAKPRARRTR